MLEIGAVMINRLYNNPLPLPDDETDTQDNDSLLNNYSSKGSLEEEALLKEKITLNRQSRAIFEQMLREMERLYNRSEFSKDDLELYYIIYDEQFAYEDRINCL